MKCVCGKEAVKPIPEGVDDVVMWTEDGWQRFETLCPKCYIRIERLKRRFKPNFYGMAYAVTYDKENDLFTISTYNEYGDRAYLSESQKQTVNAIKNLYTGETTFMEGDEITSVF